jgi:hypothetical protein
MSTDETQPKKKSGMSWPMVIVSSITVALGAAWVGNYFF